MPNLNAVLPGSGYHAQSVLCRDRVGGSTENAIQLAHTDNHCAKALETQLCIASQQLPEGHRKPGIPLAPTMDDVREYNAGTRRQGTQAQDAAAGRRTRRRRTTKQLWDTPDIGDDTLFEGKQFNARGNARQTEIYNAVGFFMYTTCKANGNGTWPETMGAGLADSCPAVHSVCLLLELCCRSVRIL